MHEHYETTWLYDRPALLVLFRDFRCHCSTLVQSSQLASMELPPPPRFLNCFRNSPGRTFGQEDERITSTRINAWFETGFQSGIHSAYVPTPKHSNIAAQVVTNCGLSAHHVSTSQQHCCRKWSQGLGIDLSCKSSSPEQIISQIPTD